METPDALIETYDRWQRAGWPPQVESRWNVDSWIRQLPEHEKFLRGLPQKSMGREEGIALINKVTDEESAVHAFLIAMIWGYGPVGYGPFRSRRVLESANAPARLLEVADIAQSRGGLEAFEHIVNQRQQERGYLKFLGPAFGTKYLYFLTAAVQTVDPTPVMDAVVTRWFRKNVTDVSITVFDWRSESYSAFLAHLREWSQSLVEQGAMPLDLGEVEYLIFAAGANFEKSEEWSEEWDNEVGPLSVSDLLDRLRATRVGTSDIDKRAMQLIDELEAVLATELETVEPESENVI